MEREEFERVAKKIVDCCITVHKEMGPGLLESVYEMCLMKEFELRGINAKSQVAVPLVYKGYDLSKEFRIYILVENEIILELKATETISPAYVAQIISYLKLTDKRLGFLVNFNVPLMKQGIQRFVNDYYKTITVQLLHIAVFNFVSGKALLLRREMHLPSSTNSRATFLPKIRDLPVSLGFAGCNSVKFS